MESYMTIVDWVAIKDSYVIDVTIRQTDADEYPCGWEYTLQLAEVGGDVLLQYANQRERSNGHERHTEITVEETEFPGMLTLYERFKREAAELALGSWERLDQTQPRTQYANAQDHRR